MQFPNSPLEAKYSIIPGVTLKNRKSAPKAKSTIFDAKFDNVRQTWHVSPRTETKRILFVPDCHVPYQDPTAYACMIEVARWLQPHVLCVLGDYADFYCVSDHLKRRANIPLLQDEAELARTALKHLVESCGPRLERKVYIAGNHEDRFDRYIARNAPAAAGLLTIPSLLGLTLPGQIRDMTPWEYVPYMRSTRIGKLHVTHDTGSAGISAHTRAMDDFQGSAVIGHTHRMAINYKGNADGPAAVGAMFGWLGDPEQAALEYKHLARAKRDFIHGLGTGTMTPDEVVYLVAHPIVRGRTVVDGVEICA